MVPRSTTRLVAFSALVLAACTGEVKKGDGTPQSTGGASAASGANGTGATTAAAGRTPTGGSGGQEASGGAVATGGRAANAGTSSIGGALAAGGRAANAGTSSIGGAVQAGGSGGRAANAGTSSEGGAGGVGVEGGASSVQGGAGAAGEAGAPQQCGPATRPASPGPYPVRFDIDIAMTNSYSTRNVCTLPDYEIYSCADGYTEPIVTASVCGSECGSGDCPVCGACPDPEPRLVTTSFEWSGNQLVPGTPTDACDCYDVVAAPAGQYRVKVPYYRVPGGTLEDKPAFECTVPFELPDPDGVVEVILKVPDADCVAIE